MNKIIIEVSIGELLDKISILEIKQGKIKDSEKLKFINNEHSILKNQLDKNVKSDDKLNDLYQSLKEINSKLGLLRMVKDNVKKIKILVKNLLNFLEMFIFLMMIEQK